jgi:hypothetical protein
MRIFKQKFAVMHMLKYLMLYEQLVMILSDKSMVGHR